MSSGTNFLHPLILSRGLLPAKEFLPTDRECTNTCNPIRDLRLIRPILQRTVATNLAGRLNPQQCLFMYPYCGDFSTL